MITKSEPNRIAEELDPQPVLHRGRFKRRSSRSTGGFSLIEVLITAGVLGTALMVFGSSMLRANISRQQALEDEDAATALKQSFDMLTTLGPTNAFQGYAPNAVGEPFPAPGSGAGAPFFSLGLQDPLNPGVQAQATVQFFTDETQVLPQFGMPRDLDGDGLATNVDVSILGADGEILADLLPVQVTITWRSAQGALLTRTWPWIISKTWN